MAALLPTIFHDDIDVIQHCDDGSVVLASNDLTGRRWEGSVWCFRSGDDAPCVKKCITAVATDSGVADIAAWSRTRFVLGLDCGAVELLYLVGEFPSILETRFYGCDHDGGVTSVSLSDDSSRLASASLDMSIKFWDTAAMTCTHTYSPAHGGSVFKVEFSANPNVFLSCGEDGKVCSWDARLPRPAVTLGKCHCTPTTVAWQPESATTFAVGFETGEVALRDLRKCATDALLLSRHQRRIHALRFSRTSPKWLASCADESKVCVSDVSKQDGSAIYTDDGHRDFVRGLSWDPVSRRLYSAGWDGQVRSHVVLPSPMDTDGRGDAPPPVA